MPDSPRLEPLVAVIIPALNEAGKIGGVIDKVPRDGRFEAIFVDDGSTDGTGDEARAHGAAVLVRHDVRGGVGAAIRDGWKAGLARKCPYLALVSGDDQPEPADPRVVFSRGHPGTSWRAPCILWAARTPSSSRLIEAPGPWFAIAS